MGHNHHHHVGPEAGDGKVAFAVVLNLGLTLAQIIGGIFAGSVSRNCRRDAQFVPMQWH